MTRMADLVILHTGDLHGRLSAAAAARLRRIKTDLEALLLDSGDALPVPNILAVPWRTAVAGRMAEAGYDAVALGNREYFFLSRGIAWAARGFSCPLVATNLILPPAAGVKRVVFLPHAAGAVAILGLARCMIRPGSLLQRMSDVRWQDPLEALREVGVELRRRARWVVVLSHLGLREDLRLACQWPEADVILGAHDHLVAAVAPAPTGPTVIHSGRHARTVSIVRLRGRETSEASAGDILQPLRPDVAVEVVRL